MSNALVPFDEGRETVKSIAMDIGKETVAYIRVMYPAAYAALGRSGQLSLRNCIYKQIMAAIEAVNKAGDPQSIEARIADRKAFRRRWIAAWDRIREPRDP